jgi:hypothetical protein
MMFHYFKFRPDFIDSIWQCIAIHWNFFGISYLAKDMTFHFAKSVHMSLNSNKFLKGLLPVSGKVPVFIHSLIHSFFGSISVIKTVGCGASCKYTKYTNLQGKILKTFYKNSIINHICT